MHYYAPRQESVTVINILFDGKLLSCLESKPPGRVVHATDLPFLAEDTVMDAIAQQALIALDAEISSLLPVTVPAGLTRQVRVLPLHVTPAGIGGYIGPQSNPQADVYARRVQASVRVAVQGGQDQSASDHIELVTRNLMCQGRLDLRQKGIFWLKPDTIDARSAQFELLYEYAHHPIETEGVIDTLDLALEANVTPYRAKFVWDVSTTALVGQADPLAEFAIADDPDLNAGSPTSQWVFNAAEARIEQNAAVRGGPLTTAQPKKAGAQLLWRPQQAPLTLDKCIFACEFSATSNDGIGVVFHRVDEDNFLYFLASERHRYHMFGRKRAGVYSVVGSINNNAGFALNSRHELKIFSYDGKLSAVVDEQQTLAAEVGEALPAGEIGFLTHGNNRARFYRARVIDLI